MQVRALGADVRKLEPVLWTFAAVEEVEPTSNAADLTWRPAVLWRKRCFGAGSTAGSVSVVRILTVTASFFSSARLISTLNIAWAMETGRV